MAVAVAVNWLLLLTCHTHKIRLLNVFSYRVANIHCKCAIQTMFQCVLKIRNEFIRLFLCLHHLHSTIVCACVWTWLFDASNLSNVLDYMLPYDRWNSSTDPSTTYTLHGCVWVFVFSYEFIRFVSFVFAFFFFFSLWKAPATKRKYYICVHCEWM